MYSDLNGTTLTTETLELEEMSEEDLEQVNGGYGVIYDGDLVDISFNVSVGFDD